MSDCEGQPRFEVIALRPFLPAKDFDTSLRFYKELGFGEHRLGPLLASLQLGAFKFLLQGRPHDLDGFAANFMMHLLVKNVSPWWTHIASLDLANRYGVQPPAPPTLQPWGLVVAYLWDPAGVLWHIAEQGN